MATQGAVLLIGNLHFVDQEWADLATITGVKNLKVRGLPEDQSRGPSRQKKP